MTSLANELKSFNNVKLGIVWAYPGIKKLERFVEENVDYFILPGRKPSIISRVYSFQEQIRWFLKAIDDFQPDIIEIYGTEYFYGLVANQTSVPVVVVLQGIVNEYKKYFFGTLIPHEIIRYPSIIRAYLDYCNRCPIEREVFRRNKIYNGRTLWDESILHEYSTDFLYNQVEHVLRSPFYNSHWEISKIQRNVIYCTSKLHPYKGVDILLKALRIIKLEVPNVHLKLAGNLPNLKFGRYLHKLLNELDLDTNVTLLGELNAEEVAQELTRAHVYVLPSIIENSPQSLAEAQSVGTPCVASYTGGVPSYVEEGKTGLLFPRGDYAVLAKRVLEIFDDDDLAVNLSRQARHVARMRHDPQKIAKDCMNVYEGIIKSCL